MAEATALTERECEEILESNGLGRLACYSPSARECYVVPVAYIYHPGTIYLSLVPGQKLSYLLEHPHGVCFEVEQVSGGQDWKTVVVNGDFAEVDANTASAGEPVRGALHKVFEVGLSPYPTDSQLLCKVEIRRLSGRHDRWAPAEAFAGPSSGRS